MNWATGSASSGGGVDGPDQPADRVEQVDAAEHPEDHELGRAGLPRGIRVVRRLRVSGVGLWGCRVRLVVDVGVGCRGIRAVGRGVERHRLADHLPPGCERRIVVALPPQRVVVGVGAHATRLAIATTR